MSAPEDRPLPDHRSDVSGAKDKTLSPAAQRALAEAEARRAEIDRKSKERPKELQGRDGPDPIRYGDWENKGIASDF
jgi:hypothetical protein